MLLFKNIVGYTTVTASRLYMHSSSEFHSNQGGDFTVNILVALEKQLVTK